MGVSEKTLLKINTEKQQTTQNYTQIELISF